MLVLTRKVGEAVLIDGDIRVTVAAIQGNRVKLSFEAPASRRILRGEVAEVGTPVGIHRPEGDSAESPRAVAIVASDLAK